MGLAQHSVKQIIEFPAIPAIIAAVGRHFPDFRLQIMGMLRPRYGESPILVARVGSSRSGRFYFSGAWSRVPPARRRAYRLRQTTLGSLWSQSAAVGAAGRRKPWRFRGHLPTRYRCRLSPYRAGKRLLILGIVFCSRSFCSEVIPQYGDCSALFSVPNTSPRQMIPEQDADAEGNSCPSDEVKDCLRSVIWICGEKHDSYSCREDSPDGTDCFFHWRFPWKAGVGLLSHLGRRAPIRYDKEGHILQPVKGTNNGRNATLP